jgi:hypothetical protein
MTWRASQVRDTKFLEVLVSQFGHDFELITL